MNKLLQHIINAGDVDHKVLPGLQKMQKAGTVTSKQPVDPRMFPKETLENRQKVYRTVRPTDYTDVKNYIRYLVNNDRDEWDDARSEEAFKLYLGLEPKPQYFRPSKYKPTINATPNEYYYSADEQLEQDIFNSFKDKVRPGQILPTDEYFVDSKFPGNPNAFWEGDKQMVKLDYNDDNLIFGRPMVSRARALGQFVVSRGSDEQGDYLSYADQYDFPEKLQNKMQGKPYKIYGRIYYPKPKKAYGGIFAQEGLEYKGPSIVDYLATKGYSGNKAFRKGLAEKYGIEGYNFSAAKNTELLNRLRENDDLLEQNYQPTQAPISVERMMEMENQARAARQAAAQSAPPPPAQRPVNPGNYYTYSPDYGDMRIAPPKINTSLQPKVKYDKFSLTPKMVIPLPFGFGKQTPSEIPNSEITDPVRPRVSIPQFNSFGKPAVKPILSPLTSNIYSEEEVNPINEESRQEAIPGIGKPMDNKFMFNNQDLYSFYKPQGKNLLPYVPANKPAVKTEKYTTESESETPWYEEAAGKVSNFFSDAYDSFAESVNKSPLDFRGMNFGSTGISPQGADAMTRDITKNILSFVSPDLAQKFENKMSRQDAINNPKERKSNFDPSKIKFDPVYVTGDTIPDTERRYHIPELMDLDYMRFGVRNRGDLKELETEGAPITAFEPFQSSKQYFAKSNDPANSTYIGVAPDGKIKVGGKDQFLDQDYQITKTFGNKVVDFNRDDKGVIKKVASNPKASKETLSPSVKVLGDDGKVVDGKLSLLLPREGNQEESFDLVTGGRYIFQTPDGKTKLVSGSLKNIETAFYDMKKNQPWVNVITLDNGSYARGIRTYDKKLTKQDLKGYDNQNTAGGNFAYILPGVTTRYESKFSDFEKEAKARLQAKYPGKNVSIGFQNTGLYDETGGRDIKSQADIQKQGYSQTPVSLHNFGAARDYILYVDGKPINADANKDLYSDVLWKAADKIGLYHVGDAKNNWDPAHIGLAKEGQKTAFDELYAKYPDIFANPNFIRSLNYVNQNKSNPQYQEYYELLNNIQPFTGQPRVTQSMRTMAFRKQRGGETDSTLENILEVFDPTGISSWDDVYRSANDPNSKWYDTTIEVAGALPLVGKLGKLSKAGIHLTKYKGLDKLLYNALPKSVKLSKTLQGAALLGRGTDAVQAGMQAPSAPFFPSAPLAEIGQFGVYAGMQNYKKENGGPILDPRGQWAHPGKITRIPGSDITMQGVNYPVLGIGNNGKKQVMYPGQEYNFGGASYVDEYPMMQSGGWSGGGLSRSNLAMMSALTKDIKNQKARDSQATISQYTPKPGDQERMNANKDAYRKEQGKFLNRLADNQYMQAAGRNLPGAAEFALDVMTAGEAATALKAVKPLLKAGAKYLTEKTPLRNAYKFNPSALTDDVLFNQKGVVNRQLFGDDAFESFKQYGPTTRPGVPETDQFMQYIKAPSSNIVSSTGEEFTVKKTMDNGSYTLPYFQEGELWYTGKQRNNLANQLGKERIITAPKSDIWFAPAGESTVMGGDDLSKGLIDSYSKGRRVLIPGSEYANPSNYSVFEPHWWKGYKQVPVKQNGGLLSRTVSCSNCGWSWKAADGGSDPMTCHKCGGTVKMKNGGQHGGLDRWFAEKWVDVKTGKDCGRQEGESRAGYPACRPSKRVNSQTPKTSSEMSSAEKAKFKASKTSSQRIDYNHKRNK